MSKKIWLLICVLLSGLISILAYSTPGKFVPMSDLLASIVAILIGVSLAISAVLATPPKVKAENYTIAKDRNLAQDDLNDNYTEMLSGQKMLFWFYYATLILALGIKFLDIYFDGETNPALYNTYYFKIFTAIFSFVSCLSLLWSATLPNLLHQINTQKMKF